jgi:hypothetical protein
MAKYLCTATINAGTVNEYRKGQVVEATSAQISALGASNFRLVNNPGAGT